ncbi:MAG: C25 family cysteine peptidase [Candidatus Cloacimonadaceae bacterium]|nr:C25 family cysteine peptidase [Candidatus Cloacimonadota bacterium]MCK9177798.1 C25 family cysteine peptidase [Candidatus Cloacimonadota bacterium]
MSGKSCLKKLLLILVIFSFLTLLTAQTRQLMLSGQGSQTALTDNNDFGFNVLYKVGSLDFEFIQTRGGDFTRLSIDGYGHTQRIGEPQLPSSNRIIAVPLGARLSFDILRKEDISISAEESGLISRILPAQAPISKSADISQIPFDIKGNIYRKNSLLDAELFHVEELGMLRGVRLFSISFEPVRYNPVTAEMKVCLEAEIKVSYEQPDLAATRELRARTASYEFERLYAKTIFNWQPSRDNLVRYPTKMLILCPPAYVSTMQTYIDWKRKQGFIVNLVTVGSSADLANSTTAIKSYMQGLWNSATANDPAPTYLIIVGDHGSSGNNVTAASGETAGHITDFSYVRLSGTDYLPEMYHGRFSVSNSTELQNVINKTLMFSQTSMPDLSYLGKTVLIAGVDASWAPTHGNGAINYATTHYFNSAHGITSNNYLYPASESSSSQIRANAAQGRGYLNYTAHGSQTSWHNPSFTAAHMTALTNVNKPFLAVGNCCITNEFNYSSPCFGEAIIRAPNAGAAYIGGINSTYWNEDYYWAVGYKTPQTAAHAFDPNKLGAYDANFHAPGDMSDWASTTGETVFMGNMAVQQSGSSRRDYYWEIYHIMGDPSLMPFYGVPTVNTASFPAAVMLGMDNVTVTAEPYSRVALSMGGTLYATGIVPASGSLNLSFTPFSTVGEADLIITASGKITRQETIQILPASGPYMTVENKVYADSNNNQPDYNESGRFNTTFKNVGANAVSNVTATLSTTTAGITITDATETISSLGAGASVLRNNAFSFNIANNIADATIANFAITMVSGSDSWTHEFNLTINAPALSFGNISISDPSGNNNGRIDPGETVTLTMPILNEGGAISPSGSASLICITSGITINTSSASFTAIAADGYRNLSFNITASASMPIGTLINLSFNATAGAYSANKAETLPVGLILEDFETGNFNSFPWIMAGNLPWTVVNTGAYQGIHAAKSGAISHNQSSTMKTTRILSTAGNVSFRYKVSSENNYDKLKFYVDGVEQGTFSGSVDWTQASYPLAAGSRELAWTYSKDVSVSSGNDCAWVDYIIFPASTTPSSFFPAQNLTATAGNGRVNLNWETPNGGTPSSYRIFRNGNLLTTVAGLSYQDNAVTNETMYSYYIIAVYPGGISDPSNTVQAMPTAIVPSEVIIGNGTSNTSTSTASPINVWYKSLHGQAVYTAAELNAAGLSGSAMITQLGFNVTGLPGRSMPNYIVRMAHTSATDVSSWIQTGLETVFTFASYQPATTGWNMMTLNTPFEWNGVDNILVDTAFGLIDSYNQSGTVEYTTVTSGYRFGRSDSSDQTNNFSSGSTSTYRPNLKLAFQLVATDEANIFSNPSALNYDDIPVGQSSSQSLRISNSGDITLTGSISTPAGFSINQRSAELGSKNERNTINFSIPASSYHDYTVVFNPRSAGSYSGNIAISSNATNSPSLNIPVSGIGYVPPTIAVNTDGVSASLLIGEQGSDSFTISNTGSQELNFNIALTPFRNQLTKHNINRSIAGSSLSVAPDSYQSGTTVDWEISAYNASTDTEWIKEVILNITAGVTINSASVMTCSSGTLTATITDNTITWFGLSSSSWGIIHGNETATATVNVSIPASFVGDLPLSYTLNGDDYNSAPHTVSNTFILTQDSPPVEWLSLNSNSGILAPGASTQITANFSAAGMDEGSYNALISISSNDPVHPIIQLDAMMEVIDASNHPPQVDLPESFSFDKNGSLLINMADYAQDIDNDPLTIQILGGSNVLSSINGLMVTLSATQNWVGTETLTFIVSDGELSASDQALVKVLPVDTPNWEPVLYPNNPATIYATVSIEGSPAQNNDQIAAFVGNECRGVAEIVLFGQLAHATILVQLSEPNETIYFKVYSYSADTIYDSQTTVQADFGQEFGNTLPIEIDAGLLSSLQQPEVQISQSGTSFLLSWQPILHADYYEIYSSDTPDGAYQILAATANSSYPINATDNRAFFKVIACKGTLAK